MYHSDVVISQLRFIATEFVLSMSQNGIGFILERIEQDLMCI